MVDRVRLWLEDLDGEMEEREASFQRIEGTGAGMVVAFFGEPGAMEGGLPLEEPEAERAEAPRSRLRVVS